MPAKSPLRVVVVDDTDHFRAVLVHLLDSVDGVSIVAEGTSGEQAVRLARAHRADVVLLDLRMPVTGWAAIGALLAHCPMTAIVVVTGMDEEHRHRAILAGAHAVVSKHGSGDLLAGVADALARVTRRPELASTFLA